AASPPSLASAALVVLRGDLALAALLALAAPPAVAPDPVAPDPASPDAAASETEPSEVGPSDEVASEEVASEGVASAAAVIASPGTAPSVVADFPRPRALVEPPLLAGLTSDVGSAPSSGTRAVVARAVAVLRAATTCGARAGGSANASASARALITFLLCWAVSSVDLRRSPTSSEESRPPSAAAWAISASVIDWTSAPSRRRSGSWRVSVTNDLPVSESEPGRLVDARRRLRTPCGPVTYSVDPRVGGFRRRHAGRREL